ncbi:MAG: hypothetical protein GY806_05850, partial [Gammaproteobacteria bacterium]|nr:hypothetical protein [Gammaproteobacteria bacterium]
LMFTACQNVIAEEDQTGFQTNSWQMKQIYQPSQNQLDREKNGLVMIYDSFTDTQVNQILDQKFSRIQSMMFTRIKQTDTQGVVQKDPESGEDLVIDDGCD